MKHSTKLFIKTIDGDSFGYGNGGGSADTNQTDTNPNGNPDGGLEAPDDDDKTDLNGDKKDGEPANPSTGDNSKDTKDTDDNKDKDDNKDDKPLEAGTVIETEDGKYTVAENGDILNEKGEVFKTAAEAKDWLAQFNTETDDAITVENLQKLYDIEVTDEDGKPLKFSEGIQGVKEYTDAVLDAEREEIYKQAQEDLFERIPILRDLVPYYISNGNSLKGFNELKDRSGIELDRNNEAQQISIIRAAWDEQNRKGNFDSYIEYLKANGELANVAEQELEGLKAADEETRNRMAKEAEEKEAQTRAEEARYWEDIKRTIDSKKIAGYQLPDVITINKDGQKRSATPNDFFNYIYQIDKKGNSRYMYDLAKKTPEQQRDDELLKAYLSFTGGSYADLVKMAINEEQVKKLKLVAKTRNASSVKITRPTVDDKPKEMNFGYHN